jgi:tRNA(fMet)-specific endonuclease VapC
VSVFVIDSNILSFYLRQNQQIINKVQKSLLEGHEVIISPIAYYEVKRGLLAIKAEKRFNAFISLCQTLGIGQFDNSLLDSAAEIYCELRNKKQTIEDADILTAAFCKSHNFILVTHNKKHFENILDLHYCDWV